MYSKTLWFLFFLQLRKHYQTKVCCKWCFNYFVVYLHSDINGTQMEKKKFMFSFIPDNSGLKENFSRRSDYSVSQPSRLQGPECFLNSVFLLYDPRPQIWWHHNRQNNEWVKILYGLKKKSKSTNKTKTHFGGHP